MIALQTKLKCIIKRPEDKYGSIREVDDSIESIIELVGGFVEAVPVYDGVVMLCREKGDSLGLDHNMWFICTNELGMLTYGDIKGPLVVLGFENEEFTDVPLSIDEWKRFVDANTPPKY